MRLICATLLIFFSLPNLVRAADSSAANSTDSIAALKAQNLNDADFQKKLTEMLKRTDVSAKILRKQITENQSAPFLANLYLQLGDVLTTKSTALYYLAMEQSKDANAKTIKSGKFSPVVMTEQKAIAIYQQILRDFPKFDASKQVLFRLASAENAIDDGPAFVSYATQLIRRFPESKEAIQSRLLLGQYFFDQQDYAKSRNFLQALQDAKYPYERDAAKYRLGLIALEQSHPAEALNFFSQVAMDTDQIDAGSQNSIFPQSAAMGIDLKREALVDSIRAYTEVYPKNPHPVAYYSKIAPTEDLFQETIEKLAYRYIFLRQYNFAIDLLRTLCERLHDPQRIVNIYSEVLRRIPLNARVNIPVSEMRFVIEKYNYWATHYNMSRETRASAYNFFEKQLRDLGTHAHELAKRESDPKERQLLFKRAEDFYVLYLGFFGRGPQSVKVAIDLADVYFNEHDYFASGSYYLRIYDGEFGPPTSKASLLQNAILSLQKPADYSFYRQLRTKGLLIRAIREYMDLDPRQKRSAELNFTLAKTVYEQGYYQYALNDLYEYMRRFPNSPNTKDAADLILNYFNTTADFKNLVYWSQKMLALNLPNPNLRKYLKSVRSKALLNRLDNDVESQGYNLFNQGRSYLQAALSMHDSSLRSVALQEALGRSKAEKDIQTFLRAGYTMAKSERNAGQKADILGSMANETLAITRFYETLTIWRSIMYDRSMPPATQQKYFEKSLKVALMLRDFPLIAQLSSSYLMKSVTPATQTLFQHEIRSVLSSPVVIPPVLANSFMNWSTSDTDLLVLFKAQFRLPSNLRRTVLERVAQRCRSSVRNSLCRWYNWPNVERNIQYFEQQVSRTPPNMSTISNVAAQTHGLLAQMNSYAGGGDPELDILVALADARVYSRVAAFLQAAAQRSPAQVRGIIAAQAVQSAREASASKNQCRKIISAASLISPVNSSCARGALPTLQQALDWPRLMRNKGRNSDPRSGSLMTQEKDLFANHSHWRSYYQIAQTYFKNGDWNHAAATSVYGLSQFEGGKGEFNSLLGCSILHMGLLGEASYLLSSASDAGGYKQNCQRTIAQLEGGL